MDNSDNLSNISDDCSRSHSNLSSISGLTGYEVEISNLRQILDTNTNHVKRSNTNDVTARINQTDVLLLEDRIKNLTSELNNCLKLNEKYKNEIVNLQHKTELEQCSKFEKLIRKNTNVQLQLDNANLYIKKLLTTNMIREKCDNSNLGRYDLESKVLHLEKEYYEKNAHVQSLENDIIHWQNEFEQLKVKYERKILEEQENKIDLDTKKSCINALKKKIAEQHVQYQQLLQEHMQINSNIKNVESNLAFSIKSEGWYKEQLYASQSDKGSIIKELSELKGLLINKDLEIQKLHVDVEKWKTKCQNVEYDNIKEKENLLKRINVINEQLLNASTNKDFNFNVVKSPVDVETKSTIEELKRDVENVQQNMTDLYVVLNDTNKKKAELIRQNTILHKNVTDKLLELENARMQNSELSSKLNECIVKIKKYENDVFSLENDKSKLETAISLANKEKLEVDNSILSIKSVFNKFLAIHKKLKEELAERNKDLLKLQNEKQQLFMNSNWHICEIEETKKEILECNKKNQNLIEENGKLICELYNLKCVNNNIKREINELEIKCSKLEEENFKPLTNVKLEREEYEIKNKQIVQESLNKAHLLNFVNVIKKYISDRLEGNKIGKTAIDFLKEQNIENLNLNEIEDFDNKFENFIKTSTDEIKVLSLENKSLQRYISKIKKHLLTKLNCLELRIPEIQKNMQKSFEILSTITLNKNGININTSDLLQEIKNLRALVKVKELEKKEKEKRYNINTHTLLKKVKEHMRGRNAAEKQINTMKQLYESTCEELTNLKFEVSNKNFEMQQFQNKIENMEIINNKLKETVISLEHKCAQVPLNCTKCLELNDVCNQLEELKRDQDLKEHKLCFYEDDLNAKKAIIDSLTNKLQENHFTLLRQEDMINTYKVEQQSVQQKLLESQKMIQEVEVKYDLAKKDSKQYQEELYSLRNMYNKCKFEIDDLKQIVSELNDRKMVHLKDIDFLNSMLSDKHKEIDAIRKQREELLTSLKNKDSNHQLILIRLKNEIAELQDELNITRNDKLFLHRLNNDMKYALQALSNQNKILVEKAQFNSKEEFRDISNCSDSLNLPSPNKLDDSFIKELLETCNERPKPLTDLQNCLNSLKKEMTNLQEEIIQKSIVTNLNS